jgi:transcriptional regulator with XRE-family HTH domain
MTDTSQLARYSALESLRINVIVERARAKLSQAELAKKAGVSRQTISRIERASSDVGLAVIERVAGALGTTVTILVEPYEPDFPDDAELARRAAAPREEFIDADALLAAEAEAYGRGLKLERFSRAGRPPIPRHSASGRHQGH